MVFIYETLPLINKHQSGFHHNKIGRSLFPWVVKNTKSNGLLFFLLTELVKEVTEPCAWRGVIWWWWGGYWRLQLYCLQAAQTQTAGVWVLLLVWSWRPPVGWQNTLQDTVETHLPWQGLLTNAPMHAAHPVPFVQITTSHPVQAMPVVHSTTWQC